jgi:cellobiose phosphorylase
LNRLIKLYKSNIKGIEKSYNRIKNNEKLIQLPGVEWLLDNYYIIAQLNTILKKEMKSKHFNSMPLNNEGIPIIYTEISNLISSLDDIEQDSILKGLKATKRDLQNKEIYSIPLFLNIGIIININHILSNIREENFEKKIGSLFLKLRQIDSYDIKEIFKLLSKTEKLLEEDETYRKMDFRSKNYYRYLIDKLSKKYKMSENEIVNTILSLSKKEKSSPKNHIGYYLIEKPLGKEKSNSPKSIYLKSIFTLSLFLFVLASLFIVNFSKATYYFALIPLIIVVLEISINAVNYFFSRYVKPKKLVRLDYENVVPKDSKTLLTIAALTNDAKGVINLYNKLENYYLGNFMENIYFSILFDFKDSETQIHPDDESVINEINNQVELLNKKYNTDCFLGFYRKRKFSESQGKFICWERKRGNLSNLVDYLRCEKNDHFFYLGKNIKDEKIKYIITLDSDTHIPIDTAKELISVADHPLNEFRFNKNKAIGGYGILQPRISTCVKSATASLFSKFFTGISGFDHYRECSTDIYQDIFGEATFTGKGLLSVDAFYNVIKPIIPENKILSHDLLEGTIVRAGLVSDIEFSDGFPSKVVSYFSRLHRWVRGDWQLISYLNKYIFNAKGEQIKNPLNRLSKWKLVDNLRRSVVPIALIVFVIMTIFSRQYEYLVFILLILATLSFTVISSVFDKVLYGDYKYLADRNHIKLLYGFKAGLVQALLLFAFLPYNAYICLDAIIRALHRQFFSKKNMLEWTTAEESDKTAENNVSSYYFKMKANLVLAYVVVALPYTNIYIGLFFCLIFLLAPYIAKIISTPQIKKSTLNIEDEKYLRLKAYQIWNFFSTFVTKKDNFLPPDNYQKNPYSGLASRTSPTNIGLYLAVILTARDFGYITTGKMVEKLSDTIEAIEKLPKYEGHLYNWYNTNNLEILKPEFISTVDSGNFIACLIALREGLIEYRNADIVDKNIVFGIQDLANFDNVSFDFDNYLSKEKISKKEIINLCDDILGENFKNADHLIKSCEQIKSSLINTQKQSIVENIDVLIAKISSLIDNTKFGFLYNRQKDLFSIGYNKTENLLVKSYYDLIASEARQASYIAIARSEVPKKHWNTMSKNMTKSNRYKGLISWTGTAFEYLMPLIFLPNYDLSLWDETYKFVVNSQISYANKHKTAFGISESAFYLFDNDLNYQYQAFGVPEHGLKRGLENDMVISPYSTFLSLMIERKKSISNLKKLEKMGVSTNFGFFEAIDYTKSRVNNKKGYNIVESYMSHHQGMSLLALNNCINDNILSKRFMANKQMKSAEELLLEKVPVNVKIIKQKREKTQIMRPIDRLKQSYSKRITDFNSYPPEATALSDGISTLFLTDRGQNYTKYGKIDITRFRNNYFSQNIGSIFYIYDVLDNKFFTPTVLPLGNQEFSYKTYFKDNLASYICENDDIAIELKANLVYSFNTTLWTITLKNKTNKNKKYRIFSYNEIILSELKSDIAHRTFNNMFLRVSDDKNGINIEKRKRAEKDQEYFYSLYLPDKDLKGKIFKFGNRYDFFTQNSFIPIPAPKEKGLYSNTEPAAILGVERELKKKSNQTIHFFSSFSKDKDELQNSKNILIKEFEQKLPNILKQNKELENYKITPFQKEMFFDILSILTYNNFNKKNELKKYQPESAIWEISISGDNPILTVNLQKGYDNELLYTLIKMHSFLIDKNIACDLVLLTKDEDSYQTPIFKSVRKEIEKTKYKNKIFVLSELKIEKDILDVLFELSNIFISAKTLKDFISSLKNQKIIGEKTRLKPYLSPQNNDYTLEWKDKEFIINLNENSNLNTVYSNIIANEKMGFIATQNGGGYTYFKNSREFKITEWVNDPVIDIPNEILYILDKKDRQVFSLTPYPKNKGAYKITNALGSISYERSGEISTSLKLFVGAFDAVKYYKCQIQNNTNDIKKLKIYFYINPLLDSTRKNCYKCNFNKVGNRIEFEGTFKNKNFDDTVLYIDSNTNISSYTFSNIEFIGGGTLANPDGFNKEKYSENCGQHKNGCILTSYDFEINPLENKEFIISLSTNKEIDYISKISEEEKKVEAFYNDFLSYFKIETLDCDLNNLVNSFLPYQIYICRILARSSYYQSGGAFGFRDQLQDGIGLIHINPNILKKQIINAAKRQFIEGDVLHWWHIFDDDTKINGIRTRFRDDALWLIYSVYEYIKITNDYEILKLELPYIFGDALKPDENEKYTTYYSCDKYEPLLEHLKKAMNYSIAFGKNGLSLFGGGDWNDGMNRVGEAGIGESVWLSWFLYDNLIRLCELSNDKSYLEIAKTLKENIDKNAWDGEWYIRGFYDDGTRLGSKSSDECKIDLIAQAWSKISKGGNDEKISIALNSAYEKLYDKKIGILKLLDPPFNQTEKEPGYIKSYIPGVRENGGQYTHSAIWGAMAFLLNGELDRGYEILRAINPAKFINDKKALENYKVEPFVLAADVYSAKNMEGRGGWSWYTGAAGWYYKVIIEVLMGINVSGNTLIVSPSFPSSWDTGKATYKTREKTFHIVYKKSNTKKMILNNKEIKEIDLTSCPSTNDLEVFF